MARNVSFISFVRGNGKLKLQPVKMSDGRAFTSMYIEDAEGNKIYVNPPQTTNNKVVSPETGEVLVDFNLSIEEIKAQIEANKENLVILRGNKNFDDPDEEVIETLTLVAKFAEVEAVDVEI